jgi:gamma-glutamyltranspeptidase/glutathione hydrolase
MRTKAFFEDLFSDGFSPIFMARVQAMRNGTPGPSAGFTTHISTVDEQGNAVAITHSLGETAGELVGNTGVVLNNFLGEADVNPPFLRRPAGSRLITMCCPSILETADGRLVAMGSGGSSRIPTAVVHGAMYMVDHDWSVDAAVRGPRTHVEAGRLHVESDGRDEGTMAEAAEIWPDFVRFDGPNLYFGGLHAAGLGPSGFCGAGDSRRSGAFGVHE